jgi:hypothetical protein
MSKEKVANLTKYVSDLKNKSTSTTPTKHKGRESSYKQFLEREISMASKKLEELKMNDTGTKK